MSDYQMYSVRLNKTMIPQIKAAVARHKLSVSDLLRSIINEGLDRLDKPESNIDSDIISTQIEDIKVMLSEHMNLYSRRTIEKLLNSVVLTESMLANMILENLPTDKTKKKAALDKLINNVKEDIKSTIDLI